MRTEKDSYILEAALQLGFDLDDRDDEGDTFVIKGDALIAYVEGMIRSRNSDLEATSSFPMSVGPTS